MKRNRKPCKPEEEQVSLLSVKAKDLIPLLTFFCGATLIYTGVIAIPEALSQPGLGWRGKVIYAVRTVGSFIPVTISFTIGIAWAKAVVMILWEWYKKQRFNEGLAQGQAQGKAQAHKQWYEWNERRRDAESRGGPV